MKLRTLQAWWNDFNQQYFSGVLTPIVIRITRSRLYDGCFVSRVGKHGKDKPARILIGKKLGKEVRETLLHEMIHQYICELGIVEPEHGARFQAEHLRIMGQEYIEAG